MSEWLVRTSDNIIAGPFTKDQIKSLIMEGKLSHQDEVCEANHYWFTLHDQDEVLEQLDIEISLIEPGSEEENTQTDTYTITKTVPIPKSVGQDLPSLLGESSDQARLLGSAATRQLVFRSRLVTENQKPTEPEDGDTDEMPSRRKRSSANIALNDFSRSQVFRRFESAALWKAMMIVLIVVSALLIVGVLRSTLSL